MKPACRQHILARPVLFQSEHAQQPGDKALAWSARQVAVARVRAPDMSTERTSEPIGISAKAETILADIFGLWTDTTNHCQRNRHKRVPRGIASANHRLRQTNAAVPGRMLTNKTPEAMNILFEMPEHKIAAIAREIALLRKVLGEWKNVLRIEPRIDQGPPCILSIFILIAEQKFVGGDQIAIFKIGPGSGSPYPVPINRRLTDTIDEPKRLAA